jgi:hypothetical protein
MKPVIAQMMLNQQKNENAARHADGQPEDVYEGVDLVAQNISDGDF